MTDYTTFEFPESILAAAKDITLSDLLDCPASQCWIISALGNIRTFADRYVDDMTPEQTHMVARLSKLQHEIPRDERMALYKQSSSLVQVSRSLLKRERDA